MVAEKPSIAIAIAKILSRGNVRSSSLLVYIVCIFPLYHGVSTLFQWDISIAWSTDSRRPSLLMVKFYSASLAAHVGLRSLTADASCVLWIV